MPTTQYNISTKFSLRNRGVASFVHLLYYAPWFICSPGAFNCWGLSFRRLKLRLIPKGGRLTCASPCPEIVYIFSYFSSNFYLRECRDILLFIYKRVWKHWLTWPYFIRLNFDRHVYWGNGIIYEVLYCFISDFAQSYPFKLSINNK